MEQALITVYRKLCFIKHTDPRDLQFISEVLVAMDVPMGPQMEINAFWTAAHEELMDIRTLIVDNREFPELVPIFGTDVTSIIVDFLVPPDTEYISTACDHVLLTYISPICRYMYDFESRVLERSLMDFLDEEGFFNQGAPLHRLILWGEAQETVREIEHDEIETEEIEIEEIVDADSE